MRSRRWRRQVEQEVGVEAGAVAGVAGGADLVDGRAGRRRRRSRGATARTCCTCPEVSPLTQYSCRDRDQYVARPVVEGAAQRLGVHPRDHEHLAGVPLLRDGGHEAAVVEAARGASRSSGGESVARSFCRRTGRALPPVTHGAACDDRRSGRGAAAAAHRAPIGGPDERPAARPFAPPDAPGSSPPPSYAPPSFPPPTGAPLPPPRWTADPYGTAAPPAAARSWLAHRGGRRRWSWRSSARWATPAPAAPARARVVGTAAGSDLRRVDQRLPVGRCYILDDDRPPRRTCRRRRRWSTAGSPHDGQVYAVVPSGSTTSRASAEIDRRRGRGLPGRGRLLDDAVFDAVRPHRQLVHAARGGLGRRARTRRSASWSPTAPWGCSARGSGGRDGLDRPA